MEEIETMKTVAVETTETAVVAITETVVVAMTETVVVAMAMMVTAGMIETSYWMGHWLVSSVSETRIIWNIAVPIQYQ
jgi:hypothetical protein